MGQMIQFPMHRDLTLITIFSLERNLTKHIHALLKNDLILATNIKWLPCCYITFYKNPNKNRLYTYDGLVQVK